MDEDLKKRALAENAACLVNNGIRMMTAFEERSREDIAEIEQRVRPLIGSDEPGEIAGSIIFFRMSRLLYQGETPTMGELSKNLMVKNYTATRLVSWWVKKNLAKRMGDPKARRIVRVMLTEKGRQFNEIVEDMAIRKVQAVLGRLTPDEQITFTRLCEKIASE
jgi:DNA-binding MarR family transcriptional regulator